MQKIEATDRDAKILAEEFFCCVTNFNEFLQPKNGRVRQI